MYTVLTFFKINETKKIKKRATVSLGTPILYQSKALMLTAAIEDGALLANRFSYASILSAADLTC